MTINDTGFEFDMLYNMLRSSLLDFYLGLSKKPEVSSFVCQEIEKGIKTLTKFTS